LLEEEKLQITALEAAISKNDHKAYSETGHGIKGAALNLHLPALSSVAKLCEFLGKELMKAPTKNELLNLRATYVEALKKEYRRIRDYLPTAQRKADEEQAEGSDEGDDSGEGDGSGPRFHLGSAGGSPPAKKP